MHGNVAQSLSLAVSLAVGCIATVHKEYIPERMAGVASYLKEAKLWASNY